MPTIAKSLNERGITTAQGSIWRSGALHDLITSPRIAGLRVHNGEVIGNANWEAIIERPDYEALNAGSLAPGRRRSRALVRC
jgi:hypothetical protein